MANVVADDSVEGPEPMGCPLTLSLDFLIEWVLTDTAGHFFGPRDAFVLSQRGLSIVRKILWAKRKSAFP